MANVRSLQFREGEGQRINQALLSIHITLSSAINTLTVRSDVEETIVDRSGSIGFSLSIIVSVLMADDNVMWIDNNAWFITSYSYRYTAMTMYTRFTTHVYTVLSQGPWSDLLNPVVSFRPPLLIGPKRPNECFSWASFIISRVADLYQSLNCFTVGPAPGSPLASTRCCGCCCYPSYSIGFFFKWPTVNGMNRWHDITWPWQVKSWPQYA